MRNKVNYGIVGVGGFGARCRKTLRESGAFSIVGGVDIRENAFAEAKTEEGHLIMLQPDPSQVLNFRIHL